MGYAIIEFIHSRAQVATQLIQTVESPNKFLKQHHTILTTDNAKEYTSQYFQRYLASKGIHFHPFTPHTPQENSLAERLNRTIMNSARDALEHSQILSGYW